MSRWEVNDYLCQLTDISENDKELCLQLSNSSFKEIEAGLRNNVDSNDIRVTAAAAALAYYKYMLRKCGSENTESISSFKVGDVDIKQNVPDYSHQLKNAEKLYDKALVEIAPLCKDNTFAFENIEVKVRI
ncbi:MAG: hypothetical protein KBT46_08710 [Ruminococcus sp.]|nr:hypothetical protein [Candidatus Copronaster equi]